MDQGHEESGEAAVAEALREAVSAVYAVPPAVFVTERTAWVKRLRSEGLREVATEVGSLRKPSVAAGVINALVRAQDPVIEQLREVGTRLRQAQSAMDAAGLTGLRGDRDALLQAWVAAARAHAPVSITAAVESEVRDTAVAALADAAATDVVLSGTLTRALSYSGFGEVDVADAVARTSTGVVLVRLEGGGEAEDEQSAQQRLAAQRRSAELQKKAKTADDALVKAERAATAARSTLERAQSEAAKAEAALDKAQHDRDEAHTRLDHA